MPTRLSLAFVASVVLVFAGGAAYGQDPSTWLGTYEGTWKSSTTAGGYVLVIERVEGNKVSGKRTTSHPTLRSVNLGTLNFTGTIDSETLTVTAIGAPGHATLTRNGEELTGRGIGLVSVEISLKKVK